MNYAYHCALAFVSGVVLEALYAVGVVDIRDGRRLDAASMSVAWGAALLVGVNEAFRGYVAGVLWCAGLGAGTIVGMAAKDWLRQRKP